MRKAIWALRRLFCTCAKVPAHHRMLGLPLREIWVCADFPLANVRPMVEESGHPPQADPQAALQDLQALKARSTTQFKDIAKEPNNEIHADIEDQMDNYEPSIMGEDEQVVAPRRRGS